MMQIDDSWARFRPVVGLLHGRGCGRDGGQRPRNWAAPSSCRPAAGEMGRFAVRDPQGGVFTIMQFNGPADPPPGA